jgi:peptidoglycan/LPS O-acetylase OafA/YrhL
MDYRREIDGLRALAVVPVILFHAGFKFFSGGFIGVDVFFVISGYLITSILITELADGKFSIINFYERRARRILPALFVVMLTCLPIGWFLMNPIQFRQFLVSESSVALFVSNAFFWWKSGYFDIASELNPLLHTWSLAVEEQYYVFFPILLMLLWRFGKLAVIVTLLIAFVLSFIAAQWGSLKQPSAAFYLLPSRGWELLVGAFAAFYLSRTTQRYHHQFIREVGGSLGVALIIYSIFVFNKDTPFPSFYTLAPTLGTALIILFCGRDTFVGKVLGTKAFVGIGLVSYSAYLWHQPLFAFAKLEVPLESYKLLALSLISLTFLLAFLSWKYIEAPFRNKKSVSRRFVFSGSLVGSLFFITVGGSAYLSNIPTVAKLQLKAGEVYGLDLKKLEDEAIALWKTHAALDLSGGFETNKKRVLVIGDSMSYDFVTAAKMSSKITAEFEVKHLEYDDLCFDLASKTEGCALSIQQYKASKLPQESDVILMLVGFHPTTDLQSFLTQYPEITRKLVIVSSSHFNEAYKFAAEIGNLSPKEYERLATVYAKQKQQYTFNSSVRAADIARKNSIRFVDGYGIYCTSETQCPFINEKGEILVFDTVHKSVAGLNYYTQRLEQWFSSGLN